MIEKSLSPGLLTSCLLVSASITLTCIMNCRIVSIALAMLTWSLKVPMSFSSPSRGMMGSCRGGGSSSVGASCLIPGVEGMCKVL